MQHCAIVPEVITYIVAIGAHKKGQQHQRVVYLLRVRQYHEAITSCAEVSAGDEGQLRQQALHSLRAMRRSASVSEVFTRCAEVNACAEGQQLSRPYTSTSDEAQPPLCRRI